MNRQRVNSVRREQVAGIHRERMRELRAVDQSSPVATNIKQNSLVRHSSGKRAGPRVGLPLSARRRARELGMRAALQ